MKEAKGKPVDLGYNVTITPASHPRYSWMLTYYEGADDKRKRRRLYFTKKTEALKKGETVRDELMREGQDEQAITKDERRAIMAFREMVENLPQSITKPSLGDAVRLMGDTLGVRHKSKTIIELVDSYLLTLERKGVSAEHYYSIKLRLNRFEKEYGDWLACDVSREVVSEWLHGLKFAPLTVNHYRTSLTQLFNHALAESFVEKNPVAGIAKKKVLAGEVGILKPRQVASLLEEAPTEILAGLAIGFFAGVRRAELCRMDWDEIDFDQGLIEVKASKSKTAARRLIPMRESLRAWLLPLRKHTGKIMPSEMIWRTRLADAMTAAKLTEWPHNAPRHSFASYHLAQFQDAAALALEMGHGSTKMIFEHYRALVTPAAAESYWSIKPAYPQTITHIKSA
jgi:integrase